MVNKPARKRLLMVTALFGAVLLAVGGATFVLLGSTQSESGESLVAAPGAPSDIKSTPQTVPVPGGEAVVSQRAPVEASAQSQAPAESTEGGFSPDISETTSGQALIQSIASANTSHGVNAPGEVGKLQQQLLDAAASDSAVLQQVIDTYRSDPGGPGARELAHVLGEIRDPKVELLAQELANSGDRSERIKGLDLLGKLQIGNEENYQIAVSNMQANPDDAELVVFALHALPKIARSKSQNQQLMTTLSDLSRHADGGVRSASIFKLGQWAKTAEDVRPLIDTLSSDAKDDRISAAMAIQGSTVSSPQLRDALIERVSDSEELWEVRTMAADSLARFSLEDDQFEQLSQFRREQGDVALGPRE